MKTIAEQRIYLDEAHELHELLTDKWVQAILEVIKVEFIIISIIAFTMMMITIITTRYMMRQQLTYKTALRR